MAAILARALIVALILVTALVLLPGAVTLALFRYWHQDEKRTP